MITDFNIYNKIVCTQIKELFETCFTKENLTLFGFSELKEISNMCKQVANEADKIIERVEKQYNKPFPNEELEK